MRRLPVYLLLDCSESMAGPGINELQKGVERLINELQGDPDALESAHLSIITFSRKAELALPLTEISQVKTPRFRVRTGTALGSALRLLNQSITSDVKRTTAEKKGDFRPLVFLFSDGQPTDSWEKDCHDLRAPDGPGSPNIYSIGCGPDADPAVLGEITDFVFMMKDLSHDIWQKLFVWISASVSSASVAAAHTAEDLPVRLPVAPADVVSQPPKQQRPRNASPLQIFLHARCSQDGQPYLMRYHRQTDRSIYLAAMSHPLDEVEKDADAILPPVDSNDLEGVPKCPYCGNPGVMVCDCGTIVCFSGKAGDSVRCPNCDESGTASAPDSSFEIQQVQG